MLIPLDQLEPHPHNANVMPEALLPKLEAHVRATSHYPPLIVRTLPSEHFQILDGHHRAIVLRRLGHTHAECAVWPDIADDQAAMLLLTLNRLHGEDDPRKRGDLLARLARDVAPDRLAKLLPDDMDRIERLIALTKPPASPPPPAEALPVLPQAVTFFMTKPQRERLMQRLGEVDPDRTRALLLTLGVADNAFDEATANPGEGQ